MNKKLGFLLSSASFGVVLSSLVSAANYGSSMQNALKPLLDLFGGLFGLMKSPVYAIIVMKVILWIVALNLFLLAIRKTHFWGDNPTQQKSAKIIATLLSLGGIMVIPDKTIQGLFFYVGILFIIGILVVIITMIRNFSANGESVKGGWLGIAIGILLIIAATTLLAFPPYNTQKIFFDLTVFDLLFLAGLIIIIFGIMTLGGVGGNKGGNAVGGGNAESGHGANQDKANPFKQNKLKLNADELRNPKPRSPHNAGNNQAALALEDTINNIKKELDSIKPNYNSMKRNAELDIEDNWNAYHNESPRNMQYRENYLTELNNIHIALNKIENDCKAFLANNSQNIYTENQRNDLIDYLETMVNYMNSVVKLNNEYSKLLSRIK